MRETQNIQEEISKERKSCRKWQIIGDFQHLRGNCKTEDDSQNLRGILPVAFILLLLVIIIM